ncbi:MAG: hypothetical protein R3E83_00625 [Burkholderiaceae bacterium]
MPLPEQHQLEHRQRRTGNRTATVTGLALVPGPGPSRIDCAREVDDVVKLHRGRFFLLCASAPARKKLIVVLDQHGCDSLIVGDLGQLCNGLTPLLGAEGREELGKRHALLELDSVHCRGLALGSGA